MALVGFRYEPVSLDVKEVYFEEEQESLDIPNTREKSRKTESVTEWCRCGTWSAMKHKYLVLELRRSWNFGTLLQLYLI